MWHMTAIASMKSPARPTPDKQWTTNGPEPLCWERKVRASPTKLKNGPGEAGYEL